MAKAKSPAKADWAIGLREAKELLGWNVKELSQRAGVATGTVVKVMQGDNGVLLRHIEAVARVLNVKLQVITSTPVIKSDDVFTVIVSANSMANVT
jgi:transcriptional regulator with XRE-family HTH domain